MVDQDQTQANPDQVGWTDHGPRGQSRRAGIAIDAEGAGAHVAHPIHRQQLHIRGAAGRCVGHPGGILPAGPYRHHDSVQGAVAPLDVHADDPRLVGHVHDEFPGRQAAVEAAVSLQPDQATGGCLEVGHLGERG